MQITDVRIRKIASEGKMKGIVSVTFDNEFVVHDIKVIEDKWVYLLLCLVEKHQMENLRI